MSEIIPCPKCGKMPKIKRDYEYESQGYGAWCTIVCKPFLGKPHLKVEEGKASWEMALKYAIEAWNKRAGEQDERTGKKSDDEPCRHHKGRNQQNVRNKRFVRI